MNKEVKKVLLSILTIIVCVLLFDFGVGKAFDKMIEALPSEGERVAKSNYIINKVNSDVLIIGSSRAECQYDSRLIQDSIVGKRVFNCGVDGSLLLYQIVALNCILDRYTPQLIIWDFQIDELAVNSQHENLGLLYPYYWNNKYVKKFLDKHEPGLKYKIWLNSYRYNATGSRILRSLKLKESSQLGFLFHPATNAAKSIPFNNIIEDNKELDHEKVRLLNETIERAKKAGAEIILVQSPYFNRYQNISSTTTQLISISKKYGILFIDDSQRPEFIGNNSLIVDATHLNGHGAELFTSILLKQMNNGN